MKQHLRLTLLAAGMLLALSTFALAHDEREVAQRANQQGYNDGYQHGREDRDQGLGYNYQGDDYQRADRGYDPDDGDRDQFAAAYREAYRAGYDDGYNGRDERSDDAYDRGGYGRDDRHRRRGYGYNNVAYDTGYQDGIGGAQKDLRDNKSFDMDRHSWYHDANHGYSSRYGSKELYRQQYRQGYEAGYRETFGQQGPGYGRGRYGSGRRGYADVAYDTGYQDGVGGARKDLRDNKSFDMDRHSWYHDANHGYSSRYGSKELYQQQYRQGYEAGYIDTYRRGR